MAKGTTAQPSSTTTGTDGSKKPRKSSTRDARVAKTIQRMNLGELKRAAEAIAAGDRETALYFSTKLNEALQGHGS